MIHIFEVSKLKLINNQKITVKIKVSILLLVLISTFVVSCNTSPCAESELVDLSFYNSRIVLDIRYATKNNYFQEIFYPVPRCFVRRIVALKLDSIQTELETGNLGLKIFDGYRPLSVTRKMWEILPDERYVANPQKGSRHNRGVAVDVTLVDLTGRELLMPTAFDEFTERAAHHYQDLPEDILKNRATLKNIMEKYGFKALEDEWWHYDLTNYQQYPILDIDFETIAKQTKP